VHAKIALSDELLLHFEINVLVGIGIIVIFSEKNEKLMLYPG